MTTVNAGLSSSG